MIPKVILTGSAGGTAINIKSMNLMMISTVYSYSKLMATTTT